MRCLGRAGEGGSAMRIRTGNTGGTSMGRLRRDARALRWMLALQLAMTTATLAKLLVCPLPL